MNPGAAFSDEDRKFIDSQRVARLATADAQGTPHVVPIVYALVDDDLYFVIDEKPKKTRRGLKRLSTIAVNPRVAVIIDEYQDDWTRLAYLLIEGSAGEIEDVALYARVIDALRRRYPPYRQMELSYDRNPMLRIVAARRHFWRADSAALR
jgi:PPOX class probable F420-dependent enzyme